MFEKMTEDQAKLSILEYVKEYYNTFMLPKKSYKPGHRLSYAARIFDEHEIINLVDSALEFWLTAGRYTESFEIDFAQYLNTSFCSLVNSGSSANLLAFMALTSPVLKNRAIKRGDEIITVAAGFPTTVAPIIQYGAIPVFVDITIPQYNIDVTSLEQALSPKTKAVFLAHTLGNPFDLCTIKSFCDAYNLWLVEDNCDALGSIYEIEGNEKYTGTIGDIGTSSFYPPHHMTMGEGGAVYTSNPLLHKIIRSLRDWGRECMCPPGHDNFCGHRFDKQFGELPMGYDHKYVYSHLGYNLKATDMQAAIGCAQLEKLSFFVERRRHNWQYLYNGLYDLRHKFILPEAAPFSCPSWFGFLITCKSNTNRDKLVRYIENSNIQTRMLFAGNLTKHPCFEQLSQGRGDYRIFGRLNMTDLVMNNSFWLGVYPGLTDEMLDQIINVIHEGTKLLKR
jgi:CDP-6-deoxy-D-xylo-4-hexulose-3-dehydrase